MAWHYGTFICGHEGRVNIVGPIKDRERKAERAFVKLCSDCYEKDRAERIEKENSNAAQFAREMNLPELTGTEKQVVWATSLRQNLIDALVDVANKLRDEDSREAQHIKRRIDVTADEVEEIHSFIVQQRTQAKYYINNRFNTIEQYIRMELVNMPISISSKKQDVRLEHDAKAESTVYPDERVTDAAVEILVHPDSVVARFERNEKFREIVKSLGYEWGGTWEKKIKETTGTAEERAAELGNKLLNAGFPICIFDDAIRTNAVNGIYEPECKRWIYRHRGTDFLAISWAGRSNSLYEKARSLPGSKWDNPYVLVRIEHYKEVEDFASLYGFRFTEEALKLIEQQKERIAKATIVKPTKTKKAEARDGLNDILDSGSEVLADLVDED